MPPSASLRSWVALRRKSSQPSTSECDPTEVEELTKLSSSRRGQQRRLFDIKSSEHCASLTSWFDVSEAHVSQRHRVVDRWGGAAPTPPTSPHHEAVNDEGGRTYFCSKPRKATMRFVVSAAVRGQHFSLFSNVVPICLLRRHIL